MQLLLWISVISLILGFLLIDLGIFNRKPHTISMKEALIMSVIWVSLALLFNSFIWISEGSEPALAFFTGYLLEKMLSLDNMFVFVMLFSYFSVPSHHQHHILFWGIIGAIIFRLAFILIGLKLVEVFDHVLYVFGAFLLYSSYKMYWKRDDHVKPGPNKLILWVSHWFRVRKDYKGRQFFIKKNGLWYATPAFIVLLSIEMSDIIFAVDSIPAIFAITLDPFIVFTSNIFAICGLRSLYFLLAGSITRFYYLQHAISLILGFVGVKLLLKDIITIPILISLIVVFTTLVAAIIVSIQKNRRSEG